MTELDIPIEVFNRRHPTYDEKVLHWRFLEATYKGGRAWFRDNIHKYLREGTKRFEGRLERAYRFNHTKEIVDLVTKYVFKADISRDEENAPEELKKFWKKATRGGDPANVLMRQVDRAVSTYGQAYVVVDNTLSIPPKEAKLSKRDLRSLNPRCFAYVIAPQDALDMAFDDHGDLIWIMTHETKRDDQNWMAKDTRQVGHYRIWTRTHSYLFKVYLPVETATGTTPAMQPMDAGFTYKPSALKTTNDKKNWQIEAVQAVEHDLGMVPVIPVRERESDSLYDAPGLIDDIAYLDRAVANYLSNLDAIIQDQTFSILTIPTHSLEGSEDAAKKLVDLGTKEMFTYDAENGGEPKFIAPDASQGELILSVISKIITEIYHSVGMAGERTKTDNAQGIDNSSGVAKAYDFDRMNTLLKAKADRLADTENKIAALVMAWWGRSIDRDYVRYSDDFDTRSLYDDFDIANRLTLLDAPDELRRYQFARLIDKMFPHIKDSLKKEIQRQLENGWPQDSEVDVTDSQTTLKDRSVPAQDNVQGQAGKTEASA